MQRARNKINISEDHMTLFEKITQNKEALAEYLHAYSPNKFAGASSGAS